MKYKSVHLSESIDPKGSDVVMYFESEDESQGFMFKLRDGQTYGDVAKELLDMAKTLDPLVIRQEHPAEFAGVPIDGENIRRPIQITTAMSETEFGGSIRTICVCDDGTIWNLVKDSPVGFIWDQLPNIPRKDTKT